MSAIWGCVDLKGKNLSQELCADMEKPLHKYKIDRYASYSKDNVVMGCGIQNIHEESDRECLPIYDREDGLIFTADVHIYNRDELLYSLCPERLDIPDGELLFLAYKKWSADCSKKVFGSYAYAVYDISQNELTISSDHTISRSIYFQRDGDRVYFSTVTEPIIKGRKRPPQLNKKWCAYFLSMTSYAIMTNGLDTPYDGIFRVPAAHCYIFSEGMQKEYRYWYPENTPPLKLSSDEEYKQRFRELFEKITRETLRVKGKVAVRLSSGFDSGGVAGYASAVLEERGEKLFSYTHIPIDTFKKENNRRHLYSEEVGVREFCQIHPNIIPKFMSTPDRNGISSLPKLMHMGLFPVKSSTNLSWIDALLEEMHNDGCRVSLGGQFGNVTISRGSVETYLTTVLSKGRVIHFLKTLNKYGKTMGYSRKRILQYILYSFIPLAVRRSKAHDYFKDSLVNRKFAKECGITEKDRFLEEDMGLTRRITFDDESKLVFELSRLAHISDFETILTLYNGLQSFDITKDPRIIEFCYSLPMECFSNDKLETRRLSRIYLSDSYPPEVLKEKSPRGVQSSDFIERLTMVWDKAYKELEHVCLSPELEDLIDTEKVQEILNKVKDSPASIPEPTLKNLIYVYSIGIFLDNFNQE